MGKGSWHWTVLFSSMGVGINLTFKVHIYDNTCRILLLHSYNLQTKLLCTIIAVWDEKPRIHCVVFFGYVNYIVNFVKQNSEPTYDIWDGQLTYFNCRTLFESRKKLNDQQLCYKFQLIKWTVNYCYQKKWWNANGYVITRDRLCTQRSRDSRSYLDYLLASFKLTDRA